MSEKFLNPFKETKEPDFISKNGIKWWLQQTLTAYVVRKKLANTAVFVSEIPTGKREYVLFSEGKVVHESISSESILARVDSMAFDLRVAVC